MSSDFPTGHELSFLAPISRTPARSRISDLVTEELTRVIRDLYLAPGATLSETDLSKRLGVSRTPLREAISRLVEHGLLSVTAQVGTQVSLIDPREVEEAVFIRSTLETAAFREACSADPLDTTMLHDILDRQHQAQTSQDTSVFFETDEALHQEIFRLGGHPQSWNVVRRSKLQLDRLRRLDIRESIASKELLDEHRQIVALLERRDIEAGASLIGSHAHRAFDVLEKSRRKYPDYFR